jgi:hypothetical protein
MSTQETTTAKTPRSNPRKAQASKVKSKVAKAPKATKPGTKSPKAPKAKAAKGAPRSGSKTEMVLALMRRKEGVTLAEIAKATDWQNHSIRGFVSGHVIKKMGLKVESSKSDAGERTYRIVT